MLDRVPPHDVEAERAVLGCCLISAFAVREASETLQTADFYKANHRAVFREIVALAASGEAVDVLTVRAALENAGVLDRVGGSAYLAELCGEVFTASNVQAYIRTVADHGRRRALIEAGQAAIAAAEDMSVPVGEAIEDAERRIYSVEDSRRRKDGRDAAHLGAVLEEAADQLGARLGKADLGGIPTGWPDLDRKTDGWQAPDLVIVAGRPGMGKSAFALNLVRHAAGLGYPVAFFSLEMGRTQLGARLLAAEAGVDLLDLRAGRLLIHAWDRVIDRAGKMHRLPVWIDDRGGLTVGQVRSACRRINSASVTAGHGPLALVVVDYMQLMAATGRRENRNAEMTQISGGLKALAKELGVPVIALSQLSRPVKGAAPKPPVLSDLRDSGAIEQDADVVIFIHRDERNKPGVADICLEKQRQGPTGRVWLQWDARTTSFRPLAPDIQSDRGAQSLTHWK